MLLRRYLAAPLAATSRTRLLARFKVYVAPHKEFKSSSAGAADRSSTDVAGTPNSARSRRKLFQDADELAAPTAAGTAGPTTNEAAESPAPPNSRLHAGTVAGGKQAAGRAASLRQQEHQQHQQPPVSWPADVQLHVYWDLDNLHPTEWLELPALTQRLRECLPQYGSIAAMHAYACTRTLTRQVPGSAAAALPAVYDGGGGSSSSSSSTQWQYDVVLDELQTSEALTCPMCGRQCKSLVDLNKHFVQLHQREHKKRLEGPKYAGSDKARRYREAAQQLGLPRAKLAGRKGQAVQLLLQRGNVSLVQVPNGDQAADEAIKRDIDRLHGALPSLQGRVLVLVSDDRGFRGDLNAFLQAGGRP
ncbi:hypothetical protein COO60DRAFT_1700597 [Scenedesmus sp. NREL 46B-D3]|nr:hypothetical protein COO60DRAFT_1700597 [Scenedesmus sp. NREL 46B-D3]